MAEERLVAALARRPGGPQLLELAGEGAALALVGGAVRDLLLDRVPRELDAVVPDEVERHAGRLAELLGGAVTVHGRFGTATVSWEAGEVDLATQRAESYAAPGALPDVRPASLEEDLARRDFTVNAIALPLAGPARGTLQSAPRALDDLERRQLRVLHERSFIDDPTRLLRLARYAARLSFVPEPRTAELAGAAIAEGALDTVSGARLGAELRLAMLEEDPVAALSALDRLGLLAASGLATPFDRERARLALALLPADGSAVELLSAALDPSTQALTRLELPGGERERIGLIVRQVPELTEALAARARPSELRAALRCAGPEAIALAGASAATQGRDSARQAAEAWLDELRHVRLSITGEDLIAAGIPEGPDIGRMLDLALARRLDGELEPGAAAELAAALEEAS